LSKIINYYNWEALISFLEKKERKNMSEGKKKRKKKLCVCPAESSTLALHAFPAFPIQYSVAMFQNLKLPFLLRFYVSRALCIIVLRSQGSDYSVILRGLNKG